VRGNLIMPVTISVPTALRQFANGETQFELEAANAGEALEKLTRRYPQLRRHLYNDQDALRNFVNVYVNDEDIRHHAGTDTAGRDGDAVMIVPAIAGGVATEADLRADLPALSNEEIRRYSRHLIMPEVGIEGQRKLKAASVLMVGTGGLGAPL